MPPPPCDDPPEVEDEEEGNNLPVRGVPPAKKSKIQDELAEIKVKLRRNQENMHARIDKLVGSVNHMAQCVDEFNDHYKQILDAINRSTTNEVVASMKKQAIFPFETPEDLYEYIENDSEMVQLIDRYVLV